MISQSDREERVQQFWPQQFTRDGRRKALENNEIITSQDQFLTSDGWPKQGWSLEKVGRSLLSSRAHFYQVIPPPVIANALVLCVFEETKVDEILIERIGKRQTMGQWMMMMTL